MQPDTCCMRNVCKQCINKWSGRIKRCMICKNVLSPFKMRLDYSSLSNFLSSVNILKTTYPCSHCGVRIFRDIGCTTVTCTACQTTQTHGLIKDDYIYLILGDTWITNALRKVMSFMKSVIMFILIPTAAAMSFIVVSIIVGLLMIIALALLPLMVATLGYSILV